MDGVERSLSVWGSGVEGWILILNNGICRGGRSIADLVFEY